MQPWIIPPGEDLSIVATMAGIGASLGGPVGIFAFPQLPVREAAAKGMFWGNILGSGVGILILIVRNVD